MTEKLNAMPEETINDIILGENTPKIIKHKVSLPRTLVFDIHNDRYRDTSESYAYYIALIMVLAKIMFITCYSINHIIPLWRLRKEWCAYGFDSKTLWSLLHNIGKSPLCGYIIVNIGNATITITSKWLSAVVGNYDADFEVTGLNYVRVPVAIIPFLHTHAPAVEAVIYGLSKNVPPHTVLLQRLNNNMPIDELRAMVDEVMQGLNTNNTQTDNRSSAQTLLFEQIIKQLHQITANFEKLRQMLTQMK